MLYWQEKTKATKREQLVIVNGQRNKVILDIQNKEKTPYTVFAISGQVSKVDDFSKVVRNVSIVYEGKKIKKNRPE